MSYRTNNFTIIDQTGQPVRIDIFGADEWSGLYINGKLEEVHDTYWVYEKLFHLLGINQEADDTFMLGQNTKDGVAKNLTEIYDYRLHMDAIEAEADKLEEMAAELRSKAQSLRGN